MLDKVRVSFSTNEIRVVAPLGHPVLEGPSRIYLANILGLDPTEEPTGYVRKGIAATATLLGDIVDYFEDRGLQASLNPAATKAVAELQREIDELQAARKKGRSLKETPVSSLSIPGLKRSLKPYQKPAVAHLAGVRHAANFSVPGSGKTTIALATYALLKRAGEVDRLVVVGPRASFMPWEEEFKECFGRRPRSTRLVGTKTRRQRLYRQADDSELVLLTYQMASNDVDALSRYLQRHRVMLVLDESHTAKRLEGGTWAEALVALAPFAAKRVILSGTPVPNSITDLWSQIAFLWPGAGVLGERDEFRRLVTSDEEAAAAKVREDLYPFYWRIRKEDLRLPRPRVHKIVLTMSPYQQAIYDVLAARVLADSIRAPQERVTLRMWRRARMVRLLQAASNPALLARYSTEFRIPALDASGLPVERIIEHYPEYETPEKVTYVVRLVRTLAAKGYKVLLWTAFVHNIKTLEAALADLSPACIWGEVPRDATEDEEYNREHLIREFKTSPKRALLIANPSACAESVSLHNACFHAIYFDRTFNGAHYMQSLDRIHRVGLTRPVHYYILQSEHSIDTVIDERLNQKMERMLALLNDDFAMLDLESPIGAFSEEADEDRDFEALLDALRRQGAAAP